MWSSTGGCPKQPEDREGWSWRDAGKGGELLQHAEKKLPAGPAAPGWKTPDPHCAPSVHIPSLADLGGGRWALAGGEEVVLLSAMGGPWMHHAHLAEGGGRLALLVHWLHPPCGCGSCLLKLFVLKIKDLIFLPLDCSP